MIIPKGNINALQQILQLHDPLQQRTLPHHTASGVLWQLLQIRRRALQLPA
jgi:hypothetical protein